MSNNNPEEQQVDRLSGLPEPIRLQIISLLPFKFVVRTSFLARGFRHHYKVTSSVELHNSEFPFNPLFNDVTSRYLSLCDPSAAIRSLSLKSWIVPIDLAKNWLDLARSLAVRHLSRHLRAGTIGNILPFVLCLQSLQTLVIHNVNVDCSFAKFPSLVPPSFSQTQLKYLRIKAKISPSDLRLLVLGLSNLEHLSIRQSRQCELDTSSPTTKTLKITPNGYRTPYRKISLCFPSLQFLDLSIGIGMGLKQQVHVNMPVLKSAAVTIQSLYEEDVPVLCDILRAFSNVSELTLHIGIPHPKRIVGPARRRKQASCFYTSNLFLTL